MKKSMAFIYALFSYIIFLCAFLYAIGFVGNFIVPKSINSGTETDIWHALFINLMLLTLFALQHSIMARPKFKDWLTSFINPAIERSTFVLITSLILLLIFWQWQPMNTIIWKTENEIVNLVLLGISLFGWLVVLLSTFMIDHFELFGLKQVIYYLRNKQEQPHELQINYFYKIVRHPIMLGFIIAFSVTPLMTLGHLIFTVSTTIFTILSVKYLEEKDLQNYLGKEYEEYQKKVPMLIPFLKPQK